MRQTPIQADTGSSTKFVNKKGVSVANAGIGILHIDSHFPLLRGHLQNARTLGIPLQYECVEGISPRQIVNGDRVVGKPLIAAAKRLEDKGAGAIIGTCGSFIRFQSALVREVEVPVFSSILMAVPLLLQSIRTDAKIGLVFASKTSFTQTAITEAAIRDTARLVLSDCMELPAFLPILENRNGRSDECFSTPATRWQGGR